MATNMFLIFISVMLIVIFIALAFIVEELRK